MLRATGLGLPAGASSASLALGQDERVGALAMLDLVKASATASSRTAAATCAAGAATAAAAAAIRPSALLPSSAAHYHQKRCQGEQVGAQAVPQHRTGLGSELQVSRVRVSLVGPSSSRPNVPLKSWIRKRRSAFLACVIHPYSYSFSQRGHLRMLRLRSSFKFLSRREKLYTCLAERQLGYRPDAPPVNQILGACIYRSAPFQ